MARSEYLIIGAGLAGSVLARELAAKSNCRITILEERSHIAGNCHTSRDATTDVMVHEYGPHIFNTNRKDVWDYVNSLVTFMPFTNRVKASTTRGVFSMPINLHTINQFFNKRFTPKEAETFVASLGDKSIAEPRNFEEQALKFIGKELYETFFYGYTKKQWGCEPCELSASILKRLPVRFNYDDNYYNSIYQGIPKEGYTEMVRRILDHKDIAVSLGTRYDSSVSYKVDHTFYTGPLDAFFGYKLGRLGYRTVTFDRINAEGNYQGNAVINYPGMEVAYTRIHEHKHFAPWETHDRTVAFREFSKETESSDTPYYPKHLAHDRELLAKYVELGKKEKHVSFLGRLGTYRYLNMDQVIGETLDFASTFLAAQKNKTALPVFPTQLS